MLLAKALPSPRLGLCGWLDNSDLDSWWLLSWLAHALLQLDHTHRLGDEACGQGVAHKL